MTAVTLARTSIERDAPRPSDEAAPAATEASAGLPLVSVENVSKRFATDAGPLQALNDVSLTISSNGFFTLLGPSGCGKTTLLRMIAGFEHADSGIIRLEGRDVGGDPPNRRPVNIVFQSYALFPHLTVAQNIAFGLERLNQSRRVIKDRVEAMLRLVRLEETASRLPAQLSGGQQQRVALARALAPNPKLLLLDEPMSALDRKLRHGMQIELKRIQRETGIAFLLVTHDQEEALSMSDSIAVMNAGCVMQIGTPRDIYERPRSRFVADFMGANLLPGRLVGLDVPFAAIRPECIGLSTSEGLAGTVKETTYLGASTTTLIVLDDGPVLRVENAGAAPAIGAPIRCTFPASALVPLET